MSQSGVSFALLFRYLENVFLWLLGVFFLSAPRRKWAWLPGPALEDKESYHTGNQHHLVALHTKHGDTFVTKRNGKRVVFVRGASGVRGVLMSKDFGKVWQTDGADTRGKTTAQYVHNLIQPLLADPVFSQKGATNGASRSILAPLLHAQEHLKRGFAARVDAALSDWPVGVEVDILSLTHDLIRSALYHAIAGDLASRLDTIASSTFEEAMNYFVRRYQEPAHDHAMTETDNQMMCKLHTAAILLVAEFREFKESRDQAPAGPISLKAEEQAPNCPTLLNLVLDADCTDAESAAVLVNVVIAAAEAPASALAHTLHELAFDRSIQDQLKAELVDAQGADPCDKLEQLPFGKACVLEGLRMFAPATLVKRQVRRLPSSPHVAGIVAVRGHTYTQRARWRTAEGGGRKCFGGGGRKGGGVWRGRGDSGKKCLGGGVASVCCSVC